MGFTQNIEDYFVGNLTFPITNFFFNRKGILKKFRYLLQSENFSEESLREYQLERLREILDYACKYIPYYRKKFDSEDIHVEDIHSLEDFSKLPELTRQDVIENHHDLIDDRILGSVIKADEIGRSPGEPILFAPFRKDRIVRNTSSGSTGAPTVFYEDGSTSAVNWANELRLRYWYGLKPGVRESRMSKLSTDYNPNSKTLIMRKKFWHQQLLPGTNLIEKDYAFCVNQINAFKPQVIWGYPSALAGLSDYLDHTGISLKYYPTIAITWAGPLYDHEERTIIENLKCSVTNIYGSREVGHIAAKCPHASLHINQESVLVEQEDQGIGKPGELIVTTLWNSPMPFIRYRMGDIGKISKKKCSCGRNLQVIDELVGRTGEIFISPEGRMISPNFWCRTFMNEERSKSVKRFQVIYNQNGDITVKIVRNNNYTDKTESELLSFLQHNFSKSIKIHFNYVSDIKASISGKYQMVTWE